MTLPSFIESPRFPNLLGWEYSVEPLYFVDVVPRGKAFEDRNLSAVYPRRRITVRVPENRIADIVYLNRFHHAVRGRFIGFRVQDPTDYLSRDLDPYTDVGSAAAAAAVTAIDQPLAESNSYTGWYQMIKRYRLTGDDLSTLDQDLPIVKPVAGTIRVANHLGVEQAAATWDIDTERGLIAPGTGFAGIPTTWGGQFDLPMRFESGLPIDVRDFLINGASFSLYELRTEL